jgi:hypothetical protein
LEFSIVGKLNFVEHSLANYKSNGTENLCGIKTLEFAQTRNQSAEFSRDFFLEKVF